MRALLIILNKDNAEGLKRCLESLSNQTTKEFDVLVLDGASKDNSEEVAKSFKVEFRVQRRLGGTGFARVEGCEYAIKNGYDVVIWGDSENVYYPDYVEKILIAAEDAEVVGGVPVVRGGFFAHAFAWYHAIHLVFPISKMHIPGNNRAERVEIYGKLMYPESRRAEDYGFTLLAIKKKLKLKQEVVDAKVKVSLPEKFSEIIAWQKARAKGVAEAAKIVGVFPFDSVVWLTIFLPFILLPFNLTLSVLSFIAIFLFSLLVFFRSLKFLERPKKIYFFAPLFGLVLHSAFNLLSLLHYLRLKIF